MSSLSNKDFETCEVHFEGKTYIVNKNECISNRALLDDTYFEIAFKLWKKYGDSFINSFINDQLKSVPAYQREEYEK